MLKKATVDSRRALHCLTLGCRLGFILRCPQSQKRHIRRMTLLRLFSSLRIYSRAYVASLYDTACFGIYPNPGCNLRRVAFGREHLTKV